MKEEISRFRAQSEDGEVFTVHEYQEVTDTRYSSGSAQRVGGLKVLLLSDGRKVGFIDDNTFQIMQTGQIIRRI